jgi:hypothetical protein
MYSSSDPSDFDVTTSFEGPNAVLALNGSAENLDAFDLGRSFGRRHRPLLPVSSVGQKIWALGPTTRVWAMRSGA